MWPFKKKTNDSQKLRDLAEKTYAEAVEIVDKDYKEEIFPLLKRDVEKGAKKFEYVFGAPGNMTRELYNHLLIKKLRKEGFRNIKLYNGHVNTFKFTL